MIETQTLRPVIFYGFSKMQSQSIVIYNTVPLKMISKRGHLLLCYGSIPTVSLIDHGFRRIKLKFNKLSFYKNLCGETFKSLNL